MKPNKDPFAALKYPDFFKYISGNLCLTAALLVQEVLLGYEIYKITKSPLMLGLVGLAQAIPFISLALFGGHIADRFPRLKIMKISQTVTIFLSLLLVFIFLHKTDFTTNQLLIMIYLLIIFIGFARGIYHPASASLKAFLTPRQVYGNAASWSGTFWQTGAVLGPGLAGFLYAGVGLVASLGVTITLLVINFIFLMNIPEVAVEKNESKKESIWESIAEGFRFVFNSKILFYSIALDLVAVLFGGVVAILPVFAEDILKVGPEGLGIMRAAPSVGAVLTIIGTTYFSPVHKAWQNMIIAVAGFGLATLCFALSTNFYLSIIMLFLTGAFDSISVVIRQTILQVIPPENLRGRVVSVSSIFVTSSNEIGAFESGAAAALLGTVPSVVAGAGLTLVIIIWVYFNSKELLKLNLK